MSPSNNAEERMIPLPLCAQRLGISWNAAYRMVLRGDLAGEYRHGRWMIAESALNEFARQAADRAPIQRAASPSRIITR